MILVKTNQVVIEIGALTMIQAIVLAAGGLFLLTTFSGSVVAAEQQL